MRLMAYTAHITIHRLTSVGKSLDEDPIKEHKRETETILESPGNYINRKNPGNHDLGIVSFFHKILFYKHHCCYYFIIYLFGEYFIRYQNRTYEYS